MAEEEGEEKEGQEQAESNAKASKRAGIIKLIVIAVVALAVIAGGGFAAWKFISGTSEESAEVGEKADTETKKEKDKEPVDPKALLFALDPFVVNLGGPGSFLKITIQLEMTSPLDKTYIEDRTAQVRDSILILLSSKTASAVVSPAGKLQLKDDINVRVNKALGKDIVRNVYFTEFVMQ